MSSKKLNQIKIIKILVICTKALYYLTLYKDKEKYFNFLELTAGIEPATASHTFFGCGLTLQAFSGAKVCSFSHKYLYIFAGALSTGRGHSFLNFQLFLFFLFYGANGGDRTRDLSITNQLLYRLSHVSIWCKCTLVFTISQV